MIHFKTDSYPMQIKRYSCDAEIGSVKKGWHVCNRNAVCEADGAFVTLHFCAKHAPRARAGDLRNLREIFDVRKVPNIYPIVCTPEHG